MKRGFDYFSAEGKPIFVWVYWSFFVCFLLVAIGLAVALGFNPFPVWILSLLPLPIIWTYRIVRHPFYAIEDNLQAIDPELYRQLRENLPNHPQAAKILSSPRAMRGYLFGQLMAWKQPISDERIRRYVRNTRSLYGAAQYSLAIWFLFSAVFYFILIGMSHSN